jgi:hypothetical protein
MQDKVTYMIKMDSNIAANTYNQGHIRWMKDRVDMSVCPLGDIFTMRQGCVSVRKVSDKAQYFLIMPSAVNCLMFHMS